MLRSAASRVLARPGFPARLPGPASRPGFPVHAPIRARMAAIGAELAGRVATRPGLPGFPRAAHR